MFNGKNILRLSFVVCTCILMLFLLIYNCTFTEPDDDDDDNNGVSHEYDILITLDKQVIPADMVSTANLTIQLISKETGLPGDDVYITVGISDGSISPASGVTDSGGYFLAQVMSGINPGTATIMVRAGGSFGDAFITYSGEGLTFSLRASHPLLCGNGVSSTDIIAELDVGGTPLEAQIITFSAEHGCINDVQNISPSVITNPEGIASVYLRSAIVDQFQGGLSSTVTATWSPSGSISGSPVTITTTVFMEPTKFKIHFEDLNGNPITKLDRDGNEVCLAVALLRCDTDGSGIKGLPIIFETEKGYFLEYGTFTNITTVYTDQYGRASAELWPGFCETGAGSCTVTAEVESFAGLYCDEGNLIKTSSVINFMGTTGPRDPLCLVLAPGFIENICRDDPRRSYVTFYVTARNGFGDVISDIDVIFTLVQDGGLSTTVMDCRPIPPPQCDTKELIVRTNANGVAQVFGYVCHYGLGDLEVQAKVYNATFSSTVTISATGIGLEEGL